MVILLYERRVSDGVVFSVAISNWLKSQRVKVSSLAAISWILGNTIYKVYESGTNVIEVDIPALTWNNSTMTHLLHVNTHKV